MKHSHWTCICLGGLLLMGAAASRANADAWNKKTYVTIGQSIEVPGAVLGPGKYVFKLLDSASNRHIVQIMNAEENHVYATNLAIPKQRMEPAGKTILTFYEMPGGGPEPIRAWFYPGDTIGQEFAYPRKRATEIAQAMKQDVPILAESRQPAAAPPTPAETTPPAAESTTSPDTRDDRSAVPTDAEEPTPAPPLVPETSEAEQSPVEQPAQQPAAQPSPTTTDSTPAEPKMPQTAGNTAAIGLIGLCCLGAAATLRRAARRAGSQS